MSVCVLERPENSLSPTVPDAYYLGDIRISPPVVLAPMADVTNGAYRRLVKRIAGPGLLVTELISTMALHHNSKRTYSMFDVTPEQHPLAVQLFGSDPEIMANAARVAVNEGADIIDINMGCWVPKVCKTGAGAAMMRDEETACRVVGAIIDAVAPVPVTVKMRAGWDYGHLATAGLARKLERIGVAGFALHGRFAVQGHSGNADWNLIREMKQAVGVPLVGNGDIKQPEDAVRMFAETGCDGVMIGRAAIGNPWIVRDVVSLLTTGKIPPPPTLEERIETALAHVTDLAQNWEEERAVRHLRGQLPLYISGIVGAPRVREAITRTVSIAEVRAVFAAYCARLKESAHASELIENSRED